MLINNESTDGKIVDASSFFEARRQLAAVGGDSGGFFNIEYLTKLLAGQAPAFLESIGEYDVEVAERLKSALPHGMKYSLSLVDVDNESEAESCKGVQDDEFEVYQRDADEVWLSMTPHALGVSAMFLESIIYKEDAPLEDFKRNLLDGAAVQLAWLALGKWAFDQLDPPNKNAVEVDRAALAELEQVAKMKLPELADPDSVERKQSEENFTQHANSMFTYLKYGLAGRLAYDGLMSQSRKWASELIDGRSVRLLQGMHQFRVEKQSSAQTGGTTYDLAVAYALPRHEVPGMFDAMQRL